MWGTLGGVVVLAAVAVLDATSAGRYQLVNVGQGAIPVEHGRLADTTVLDAAVLATLGVHQP